MMAYLNCHFALESRRSPGGGPRVMIIGPEDSGKTSLIKILAAYALKLGRSPLLVNLDTREGMSTTPGTISAMPINSILDVTDGFGASRSTGTTELTPKIPLSYCYGSADAAENVKYYKHLLTRLSLAVNSRLSSIPKENQAGLLIDTPGLIDQSTGYDIIQSAISDLEVNVLIVLGSERLYSDMLRKYESQLTVLKLPKSGGVVGRDATYQRSLQASQIRKYFYGDLRQPLNAFSLSVAFTDLRLFQIDDASSVNTSLMPIGLDPTLSKSFVSEVPCSSLFTSCLVAMLDADSRSSGEVMGESSVVGYLLITDVDDEKKRVTLLAPFQGKIPNNALLVTKYRYTDI